MYKRFRTAEGKRMKVRMTDEEVLKRWFMNLAMTVCGLFIGFLVWGAML